MTFHELHAALEANPHIFPALFCPMAVSSLLTPTSLKSAPLSETSSIVVDSAEKKRKSYCKHTSAMTPIIGSAQIAWPKSCNSENEFFPAMISTSMSNTTAVS